MSLLPFCHWLEQTPWSIALHESLWVYPLVESVHVLTLCLFLGTVALMDLRLIGLVLRDLPASEVITQLAPWTRAGFIVMVISGALLFYAIPVRTYENIFFRVKVVMLVLAGLNAWVFHRTAYPKIGEWDFDAHTPRRARLAGVFSLVLWAGIVTAGRMIAYNWFDKK
jgi:hypothetical protein